MFDIVGDGAVVTFAVVVVTFAVVVVTGGSVVTVVVVTIGNSVVVGNSVVIESTVVVGNSVVIGISVVVGKDVVALVIMLDDVVMTVDRTLVTGVSDLLSHADIKSAAAISKRSNDAVASVNFVFLLSVLSVVIATL